MIDEATGGFRHFRIALSPEGKPYRHDPSEKLPEGFTLAAEYDHRFYSEDGIMLAKYMSVARICDYKERDFVGWTDEQRDLYLSRLTEEQFRREFQGDFSQFREALINEDAPPNRYCRPRIYGDIIIEKLRFADTNEGCVTPVNLTSPNGNVYHVTIEPYDKQHFRPIKYWELR